MPSFYPGVAQLVGRLLWEQDAARSSRATRTSKNPVNAHKQGAYGIFSCFTQTGF